MLTRVTLELPFSNTHTQPSNHFTSSGTRREVTYNSATQLAKQSPSHRQCFELEARGVERIYKTSFTVFLKLCLVPRTAVRFQKTCFLYKNTKTGRQRSVGPDDQGRTPSDSVSDLDRHLTNKLALQNSGSEHNLLHQQTARCVFVDKPKPQKQAPDWCHFLFETGVQ